MHVPGCCDEDAQDMFVERTTDIQTITSTALHWTPDGKIKKGRPRTTWRRTVEREIKAMQHSWGHCRGWLKTRGSADFDAALGVTADDHHHDHDTKSKVH